jgi:hypothetical protein
MDNIIPKVKYHALAFNGHFPHAIEYRLFILEEWHTKAAST